MKWIVHLEGGPKRVNHAAVALNDGSKIYSFGGYSSADRYDESRPLDTHVLDTYTYRWSSVPMSAAKADELYYDTPYQRYGHTVVEYCGGAYLWGGRNDSDGGCSSLYLFDPRCSEWLKMRAKGVLPPKRDGHSACVYRDSMIIFAGYEEEFQRFSNETYELDFRNMQWNHVQTSGQSPAWRDFHTATVIDHKMYVFGGRSDYMGQYLSTREKYDHQLRYLDLSDFSWRVAPTFLSVEKPEGRRSHSAWCYNDELYIFGGFNGNSKEHFNDLFKYDAHSKKWVKMLAGGLSPRPRRRQCCVPVADRVFLFGGTSPKNGTAFSEDEDSMSPETSLIDHSDLHVLDMLPTLKTLCLSLLVDSELHISCEILDTLPVDVRIDIATMSTHNKINSGEAQQQHGLRHDNYQRYRFLLICLFEAERCWAYAEQLRQEASNEPQSRKLFQALNKLRRAVKHSQLLEELCKSDESNVDAATKLEAQAYNAWLHGCLNIALKQFQNATINLNTAKTIYDKLSCALSGSEKNIYQERYHELLAPQLRLCYANLNEPMPTDVSENTPNADIEKLIAQTRERQLEDSKFEIDWCKSKINVSKASTKVKSFVSSWKQFDDSVDRGGSVDAKISLFEQLLVDCRDAMQTVRDEFKDESTKPQDMIRLYDAVLQNLSDILSLPGTGRDSAFVNDIERQIAYYTAFRCYYVADLFSSQKKWRESLALYHRTLKYVKDVRLMIAKSPKNVRDFEPNLLDDLERTVQAAKLTAHANCLVVDENGQQQTNSSNTEKKSDEIYAENFTNFRHLNAEDILGPKKNVFLTRMPPDFLPMPCKPLFFDLALNHLKFPSLESKMESTQQQESNAKKSVINKQNESQDNKGIGGFMKGWFWGGGKN
uniref:Signal recognition particle subunit SRP68 n=1 Tax=Romanomermis culicivorax TaxID=13658 RepID=A0A915IZ08_ROMCU